MIFHDVKQSIFALMPLALAGNGNDQGNGIQVEAEKQGE
jgi:hypothetical protein